MIQTFRHIIASVFYLNNAMIGWHCLSNDEAHSGNSATS